MLSPFPVVLVPYEPAWALRALELAGRIERLGENLVEVHHIGSTAVEGLAAKPIIDLMPVVRSLDDLDGQREMIENAGLGWHGEYGIPGRRYCTLSDGEGRRVAQYHFFEAGSREAVRHLAFRDYLRAYPDMCREYANEKRRARALLPGDSHAYSDEKAAWVRAVEERALQWYAGRDGTTG